MRVTLRLLWKFLEIKEQLMWVCRLCRFLIKIQKYVLNNNAPALIFGRGEWLVAGRLCQVMGPQRSSEKNWAAPVQDTPGISSYE